MPVESVVAPMSSRTIGPLVGDHLDRQRGPVDALQAPQVEDGRRDAGAGVAGGDDRVGLAVADEAHADVDARVALAADGGSGMLLHGDRLGGLDDAARWPAAAPSMKRTDARLVADEDDVGVGLRARPVDAPRDDLLGRVVAAHRVDGDAHAAASTTAVERRSRSRSMRQDRHVRS